MDSFNEINIKTGSDCSTENENENLICLKNYSKQLSAKFSFLNEDLNLIGNYQIIEFIRGDLCLNLLITATSIEHVLRLYKEKVKMLDDINDQYRLSESETARYKKLFVRKNHEYESLATECALMKVSISEMKLEIKNTNKLLSGERNNVRLANANNLRERNQFKNDKTKLERDMLSLKERLSKMISDPKKSYPSIEISNSEVLTSSTNAKGTFAPTNEADVNGELISSYRRQLEDVILENRQLREMLVGHVIQSKRSTRSYDENSFRSSKSQRNNSSISRNSSDSDISVKSNETFIVPKTKSKLDEKLYLEMPFSVIKEDLSKLLEESCQSINSGLIGSCMCTHASDASMKGKCFSEFIDEVSTENNNHLQKEILKLRRQCIDYENIIQGKDSLLDAAIEQRMRIGSLLPHDSSYAADAKNISDISEFLK